MDIINSGKGFFDSEGIRYEVDSDGDLVVPFGYRGRRYQATVTEGIDEGITEGYLYIGGLGNVPEDKQRQMAQVVAFFNRKGVGKAVINDDGDLGVAFDIVGPAKCFDSRAFKYVFDRMLAKAIGMDRIYSLVVVAGKAPKQVLRAFEPKNKPTQATALDKQLQEILEQASQEPLDGAANEATDQACAWAVVLLGVGPNKVAGIKKVREVVDGIDLEGAKALVERAPVQIISGLTREKASIVTADLESAGVKAKVIATGRRS
ncbi:MAG: ribosomal protein L7/L12 [Candidatus Aenigmarchaeota archaeon]|nr:ribosomal protein L7/L12 [Candidatus Aenigmarchaeota archaeon]